MSLNNSTILITGGLGQVGIAIVECLQKNYPSTIIHVLDLRKPGTHDPRNIPEVFYHAGNIIDASAVRDVLQNVKPQIIFHTAGLVPQIATKLGMNNEESFTSVNVEGTRNVLEESKKIPSIKAFVYTSTADVVKGMSWEDLSGVTEEMQIPESFDGLYAKSKALSETLVLSSSSPAFPTTAIRAHAVFSANDKNIIPLLLAAPRNIRLGPGTNLYDFTYAPNLALAHCLAAKNLLNHSLAPEKSAAGKAFFVTNAEPVPFKDFLSWIYDAYDNDISASSTPAGSNKGKIPKVTEVPIGVARAMTWAGEKIATLTRKKPLITVKELGDSVSERWFDNGRAREVLGYVPEIGLKEGVMIAVDGYKKARLESKASGAVLEM